MTRNTTVEEKILKILSKELLSTSQVAKRLNMRREFASGFLEALMQQGKLQKTVVSRSIVYTTIGKPILGEIEQKENYIYGVKPKYIEQKV